jgi:hypothetical protein
MPNGGPSSGEIYAMECRRNDEDYGLKVGDRALATMVARALWASIKCLKTRRQIDDAFDPWVVKWFDDHDMADEADKKSKEAKLNKLALKAQGLAKLSDEEKKALGLKEE